MSSWRPILADVAALLSASALTLSVVGLLRIPDPFAKLHAAAKAVVLGVLLLLSGSLACGWDVVARAAMVAVFVLLTSPVSAHALARLQWSKEDGRGATGRPGDAVEAESEQERPSEHGDH